MVKKIFLSLFISCLFLEFANAQINIAGNQTAAALAQMLVGSGITMTNPTLTCAANANGKFVNVVSPLLIDSGIILTTGRAATGNGILGANITAGGTATTNFASTVNAGATPDAQLSALLTQINNPNSVNDLCKLEFDFVPIGDTIKFDYQFGSEEYPGYECNTFSDIFGFFISGPGITGAPDIALIPGTNVPVCINTVNSGNNLTTLCTNIAPGSPFTQYFINTAANTALTYNGITTRLTAIRQVIPCSTYHLKLAISDVGDASFDSGVFLKAGSLNSNSVSITPVSGGNLSSTVPYCVRTCLPGQFVFTRPVAKPVPQITHFQIAGTAVNGYDYTTIADSVVIPANATSAVVNIYGLAVPPAGPKTVKLRIYSPYVCAGSSATIIDSAILTIYDSFQVNIVTPDTAICITDSVHIRVQGDPMLSYSWTPVASLTNAAIKEPVGFPTSTTTYVMSAYLAGAGCIPTQKSFTVTVKTPTIVSLGADRTTCLGTPFQFAPVISPTTQTNSYSWNPTTNLSSGTVVDPVFTPSAVGTLTYILTADPGVGAKCVGTDTVNVITLPNDFTIFNHDTAICAGATVSINAAGDPAFTYSWMPVIGVSNPAIVNPSITPDTTRTYTVKASYPTCPDITHAITIDVQPNPIVYAGPDRVKCQWDTLHINGQVIGQYPLYNYLWEAGTNLDAPDSLNVVFSGEQDETLSLTVSTPIGCTGRDSMNIIVHQGNFATLDPEGFTGICPGDSIQLQATGGVSYKWIPGKYLSDSTSSSPVVHAETNTAYTGYVTDQYGCFDTVYLNVKVNPNALVSLPDTALLYPGETYMIDPTSNCLYFNYFPPVGLSATNIATPVATPEVNTKYILTATTEEGCIGKDSIVIMVRPESLIDMPNAFMPASSNDDILKIGRRGIASLKYFRIFNRWGIKVFESTNIDLGWDGRFNGEVQPMGVYIYQIEAVTNTGRLVSKQGNVTLLR